MGPAVNFNPRAYRDETKDSNNSVPAVRAKAVSLTRICVSQKASSAIQTHPIGTKSLRNRFECCMSLYSRALKDTYERAPLSGKNQFELPLQRRWLHFA